MKPKVYVLVRRHGAKRSEVFGEELTDQERYARAKEQFDSLTHPIYESITIIIAGEQPRSRAFTKPQPFSKKD